MQMITQKRQPKRSRVLLLGLLEGASGPQEVRVRDVSTNGALVDASNQPSVGETVRLIVGDESIKGRVAWIDGAWFGVEFDEPLSAQTLADTVGNKLRVSAPRGYRFDKLSEASPGGK